MQYTSRLQTPSLLLILNDTTKTKVAILTFLYFGEFVKKSICCVSSGLNSYENDVKSLLLFLLLIIPLGKNSGLSVISKTSKEVAKFLKFF